LFAEAKGLDLFKPHGAFEVHCEHCHARLDGNGTAGRAASSAGPRRSSSGARRPNPSACRRC
jgi:hypothetical protein